MREHNISTQERHLQGKYKWAWTILGLSTILNTYLAYRYGLYGESMLPYYVATAGVYISGRLIDKVTAIELFKKVQMAHSAGVMTGVEETNRLLPIVPSREDLLNNNTIVVEAGGLAAGLIFPPMGLFLGAGSYVAALSNIKAKRHVENLRSQ